MLYRVFQSILLIQFLCQNTVWLFFFLNSFKFYDSIVFSVRDVFTAHFHLFSSIEFRVFTCNSACSSFTFDNIVHFKDVYVKFCGIMYLRFKFARAASYRIAGFYAHDVRSRKTNFPDHISHPPQSIFFQRIRFLSPVDCGLVIPPGSFALYTHERKRERERERERERRRKRCLIYHVV